MALSGKRRKVLFFHHGMNPTVAQLAEASELGLGIQFRCADYVSPELPLEACDAVAGDVPDNYAKAYEVLGSKPDDATVSDDAPELDEGGEPPAVQQRPTTPSSAPEPSRKSPRKRGESWT